MPHSVSADEQLRSSSTFRPLLAKVPGDLTANPSQQYFSKISENHQSSKDGLATDPRIPERWLPRTEVNSGWKTDNGPGASSRHGRQTSLSEAFKVIKDRRGSVTVNAQELAEALKAPVSPKLIIFCIIWYLTSALTNTSSKSIMNAFPRPVTLTLVQFAFVSSWCILFSSLAIVYPSIHKVIPALKYGIRAPSREILNTTFPLALFQVGGHLLSSTATSRIPVSLVHTIKGLSPLFTVFAYRFFFRIHYAFATYLSLIPLTLGVMLACSAELSGNLFGILCAFGAAIIFVTQNIVSKKLFNEAARAEADGQQQASRKLDKLNLLCYSSALAFALTSPLWLWSEGFMLVGDLFHDGALDLSGKKDALGAGRLILEFLFNGTFHFGQNIMAFVLLSMVSPVTYSVASLIKRIFVISVAVVWFGNSTTPVQGVGIVLTFIGLYLYDRTSDAAKGDRRAKLNQMKAQAPLLPLSDYSSRVNASPFSESPISATSGQLYGGLNGLTNNMNGVSGPSVEEKSAGAVGSGRPRGPSLAINRLPSGAREDEMWRPFEISNSHAVSTI